MSLFVQLSRGANYSLVNYDWSLNLKYITVSLYIIYSILYILIITYFKLRENQNNVRQWRKS